MIQVEAEGLEVMTVPSESPEYEFELRENISLVKDALQELSAKHKEVIVLRYYLEYSETEIAEVIERWIGTTCSRIYYAHQYLRQIS